MVLSFFCMIVVVYVEKVEIIQKPNFQLEIVFQLHFWKRALLGGLLEL